MLRNKPNRIRPLIAAASGFCLAAMPVAAARAVPVTFTLDPSQSQITAEASMDDGSVSLTLTPQDTGSDVTSYTGTITADVTNLAAPTAIQILSADAAAQTNGNWRPDHTGAPATARAANYGLEALVDVGGGFFTTVAYVAVRNLAISAAGGSQAVTLTTFDASDLTFTVTGGSADYWVQTSPTTQGSDDLTGDLADNSAVSQLGSLTVNNQTLTLHVPVKVTYSEADAGSITLTGQIVATATAPEPTTLALLGLGGLLMLPQRRRVNM